MCPTNNKNTSKGQPIIIIIHLANLGVATPRPNGGGSAILVGHMYFICGSIIIKINIVGR
jgi:hypothetical protein